MSDVSAKPSGFSLWFNAILVIAGFLLFVFLVDRYYLSSRQTSVGTAANLSAEQRAQFNVLTPEERVARLVELRKSEAAARSSYEWIDQAGGVVRLPIDRAIELTVRELNRPPASP